MKIVQSERECNWFIRSYHNNSTPVFLQVSLHLPIMNLEAHCKERNNNLLKHHFYVKWKATFGYLCHKCTKSFWPCLSIAWFLYASLYDEKTMTRLHHFTSISGLISVKPAARCLGLCTAIKKTQHLIDNPPATSRLFRHTSKSLSLLVIFLQAPPPSHNPTSAETHLIISSLQGWTCTCEYIREQSSFRKTQQESDSFTNSRKKVLSERKKRTGVRSWAWDKTWRYAKRFETRETSANCQRWENLSVLLKNMLCIRTAFDLVFKALFVLSFLRILLFYFK